MTTYGKDYLRSLKVFFLSQSSNLLYIFFCFLERKERNPSYDKQPNNGSLRSTFPPILLKGTFSCFSIFRVSFFNKLDFSLAPESFIDLHGLLF